MQKRKKTKSKQSINQCNQFKTKSSQVKSKHMKWNTTMNQIKATQSIANTIEWNQSESNRVRNINPTQDHELNQAMQANPIQGKPIQPNVISRIQFKPMWFVLLKDLLSACLMWFIWLFGLIGLIWLMSLLPAWTGWLGWYGWLCWLLGLVRLPWLCLDGIIGFIGFGCIALVCFAWILGIGCDWIGLGWLHWILWDCIRLGWLVSICCFAEVGLGWADMFCPSQSTWSRWIESNRSKPNAMQPNQMNQIMPSKHSHGYRTDPRSQRNQSYQSKQPVPTNTASTSIISNQSSQPTKSVKSSMQIRNPFNKNDIGLEWMWLITLACMGLPWMGIVCTSTLIARVWDGLIYWSRFDSVGL